jgi:hypothetical protein
MAQKSAGGNPGGQARQRDPGTHGRSSTGGKSGSGSGKGGSKSGRTGSK